MFIQFAPAEMIVIRRQAARAVIASNPIPSPEECDAQTAEIERVETIAQNRLRQMIEQGEIW